MAERSRFWLMRRCWHPAIQQPTGRRARPVRGPVTGDAANLTMDPIVNLRDEHLIEL
jgi:hypothetical protein